MLDVGVDVDMDILHIAPLARFLRSSHNFKPKPEGPAENGWFQVGLYSY